MNPQEQISLKNAVKIFLEENNKYHIWNILDTFAEVLQESEDIQDNIYAEEIEDFIQMMTDKDMDEEEYHCDEIDLNRSYSLSIKDEDDEY